MLALRHPIFWAVALLIVINLVALWWVQLAQRREHQLLSRTVSTQLTTSAPISPTGANSTAGTSTTDASQLEKTITTLTQQLAQLTTRVTTLEKAATTQSPETDPTPASSTTQIIYVSPSPSSATKEFVAYLGVGSTFSRDWTEVTATSFTLEPSNYPKIKHITFEAGLSIQGGEARARLKNKTTGLSLVETEVMHNTGTTTWKSASFSPATTSTTYVVELISSSGEKANLDGARLKIVTY